MPKPRPPHPTEEETKAMARKAILDALDGQIGQITDVRSKKFKDTIKARLDSVGISIMRWVPNPVRTQLIPAQYESFRKEVNYDLMDYYPLFREEGYDFSIVKDVVRKGKKIATYQVDKSPSGTDPAAKKYIINFNGNATYALQTYEEMTADAEQHKCVVISFDYPGVGSSEGKTHIPKDMVNAGYTQVERLLKMGVPPEHIILKGQSIGGAVATMVAAKCHEKGETVYLFNQRSFAKMSRTVKALLGGGVLGKIASGAIKSLGWGMDVLPAWKKIPESHKDFCHAVNDEVIPTTASLAKGIGKDGDQSRQLNCDHNEPLYTGEVKTMTNGAASQIFNDFAGRIFNPPTVEMEKSEREQYREAIKQLAEIGERLIQQESKPKKRGLIMSSENQKQIEFQALIKLIRIGSNFCKKDKVTASDLEQFKSALAKVEHDYRKIVQKKNWPLWNTDPVINFVNKSQELAKGLEQKLGKPTKRLA